MKEENKQEKTLIEQKYDALFEKDENGKALNEDDFLNRLINLESAGKRKLFRTLLGDKTKEEVREYLQTKSREDREKTVGKDYLGKKMTISKVIDEYSKMVKNVFKTKKIKEAVKEAGIECKQVDGVILPPEGQQRLAPGGSEGGEGDEEKKTLKFKQYQEKSPVLFGDILTVENGIYPGDMVFFEGTDEKNALRYTGYVAIQIPKLNKTIFINDMKGEATFVCDQLVSQEDMKKSKKTLSGELGSAFHSVSYSEDNKEFWKLEILDLLFGPEKGSQKFIKNELMDENEKLTEKGKEWFRTKTRKSRVYFKLLNGMSYVLIARKFGFDEQLRDLYKDKNNVYSSLTEKIFGKEKKEEYEEQVKLEEQEAIRNELTKNRHEWFSLNLKARLTFKLKMGDDELGYVVIARKFGFDEIKTKLYESDIYSSLTEKIFGKEKKEEYEEQIRLEEQEAIRNELIKKQEAIKSELTKNRHERFCLKIIESRSKFKLKIGNDELGYVAIARIFGFDENVSKLYVNDTFSNLTEKIFGKEKKEKYEEQIRLEEQKPIKKELLEMREERFDLTTRDSRSEFKLKIGNDELGYLSIAGKFNVKRDKPSDLFKHDAFYELSAAIFGEDNENVKKLINAQETRKEEIRNILLEQEETRFNLKTTIPRRKFKLKLKDDDEIGYVKLAGIFGVERERLHDLLRNDAFYELSVAIFGEDNENVKELKKKLKL